MPGDFLEDRMIQRRAAKQDLEEMRRALRDALRHRNRGVRVEPHAALAIERWLQFRTEIVEGAVALGLLIARHQQAKRHGNGRPDLRLAHGAAVEDAGHFEALQQRLAQIGQGVVLEQQMLGMQGEGDHAAGPCPFERTPDEGNIGDAAVNLECRRRFLCYPLAISTR